MASVRDRPKPRAPAVPQSSAATPESLSQAERIPTRVCASGNLPSQLPLTARTSSLPQSACGPSWDFPRPLSWPMDQILNMSQILRLHPPQAAQRARIHLPHKIDHHRKRSLLITQRARPHLLIFMVKFEHACSNLLLLRRSPNKFLLFWKEEILP